MKVALVEDGSYARLVNQDTGEILIELNSNYFEHPSGFLKKLMDNPDNTMGKLHRLDWRSEISSIEIAATPLP